MVRDSNNGKLFHKANIHEQRPMAYVCRAAPLMSVLIVTGIVAYGTFQDQLVLLWVTAVFNMCLWLWVVSTALQGIYAIFFHLNDLEQGPNLDKSTAGGSSLEKSYKGSGGTGDCVQFGNAVVHMIILPNYKEDETMLAETLRALAEAEDAKSFWVVLAMEEREGEEGRMKAVRLQMRFESEFARVIISQHPGDLVVEHRDGSQNPEVPGKASNVKHAVNQVYKECTELGVHHDCVLLTIADSDSIFHPLYFSRAAAEFQREPETGTHSWTVWCPPQFPYRNFYTSPIVSRVWGYVQSTYEFGGLSGTIWGAHHMVFSAYSMPLTLAHNADAWDGDVIAEDHHAHLKSFYYWLYTAISQEEKCPSICWQSPIPQLRLRPVFLPVKSTSVANEDYCQSWVERWHQAKRHAQGVSELSYALLATYDACRTSLFPKRIFSWSLGCRLVQVVMRLWCMHVLPICQSICLATLTVKWLLNHRNLDMCPDRLWFFGDLAHWEQSERYILCGFAGAWVLTWPVVIPWVLMVVSNVLLIYKCFLRPAMLNKYASIWHSEDAKVPGEHRGMVHMVFRVMLVIICDCLFGMSWILVPYGGFVELIAYINVLLRGNLGFTYITASKGVTAKKLAAGTSNYGSIDKAGKASLSVHEEPPLKQQIEVA